RGFLPWRLSDAGRPNVPRRQSCGRHPKPFTQAADAFIVRNFRFMFGKL
ncbi:hypothetical protein ABIB68_002188, partial [Bradyrhizobium sp. F1.2.2]